MDKFILNDMNNLLISTSSIEEMWTQSCGEHFYIWVECKGTDGKVLKDCESEQEMKCWFTRIKEFITRDRYDQSRLLSCTEY